MRSFFDGVVVAFAVMEQITSDHTTHILLITLNKPKASA